jgi:hypothetical protein
MACMNDDRSSPVFDGSDVPVASVERVKGRVDRVAVDRSRPSEVVWSPPGGIGLVDEVAATLGLDRADLAAMVRRTRPVMAVVAITVIGSAVAPQAPWLLIVPAMVGVLGLVADRRTRFSFADGIFGYRADLGWPRGVQEAYDVAFRTPRSSDPGSDPARIA